MTIQSTRFLCSWMCITLLFQNKSTDALPSLKQISLYTASIAATSYIGYLSCSTPGEFTPTIENLFTLSALPIDSAPEQKTLIQKDVTLSTLEKMPPAPIGNKKKEALPCLLHIKNRTYQVQTGVSSATYLEKEPVWIASCGWDPISDRDLLHGINPNIRLAKRYLGRHIIHGPALFIAHNDDRRIFNFGQEIDQKNIDFMYHQIPPTRTVVLHGLCRGATAILGWLEHFSNTHNVGAVIFESPAVSLKAACLDAGKSFTHSQATGSCIHQLLAFYYPNYSKKIAQLQEKVTPLHINQNVPIFIGTIKQDTVTAEKTVTRLVQQLRTTTNNPIYYFICDDPTIQHARLSASKDYQKAVNAFLQRYNLPHDPELAAQGQQLLVVAQECAENLRAKEPAVTAIPA